ncbi:MAG: hypothetical protein CO096_28970 [Armatimonadetes bacterium CG_4_9_14_3_um_filter_66_14]|nr:MAG: hypothetical protein CO096_28970 [Armatimonadetes bacterium CG_4_9_14_3_um_filter_66_14]
MPTNDRGEAVAKDKLRTVDLSDADRREELSRAFAILKYTHESASALLEALRVVRKQRHATRGALTDEDQDLLRAMLVMAASGLDSMVKQLIRDLLPILCKSDESVLDGFREFVRRQLRGDAEGHLTTEVAKLFATWLTAESVQSAVIEHYVGELTGDSLQSSEQLLRATGALGLPQKHVDKSVLAPIFADRNRIIHELDIDFDAPRRNRRSRRIGKMIEATNHILALAETLYEAGEAKLGPIP